MQVTDFEDEDTQPRPLTPAGQTNDDEALCEIEWAEDENAAGELVLRVTPVTKVTVDS